MPTQTTNALIEGLQAMRLVPEIVSDRDLRVGVIISSAVIQFGGIRLSNEADQAEFERRLRIAYNYYVNRMQEQVARELGRPSIANNLYTILTKGDEQ